MKITLGFGAIVCMVLCASARATVFINEIDYDNVGVDNSEYIELAGTAGTNLSGWTLQLMNGATDTAYSTIALPNFTIPDDAGNGWGFFVAGRPSVLNNDFDLGADNSVQNGPSDGAQLIDPSSTIVQYVEYDGTALTGPNDVVPGTVVDSNAITRSIFKTGTGQNFGDFTWANDDNSLTPGALNPGEAFVPEPASIALISLASVAAMRRRTSR